MHPPQGDDQFRIGGFVGFEGAHVAQDPVLSVFPHRTGVEKDKAGLFWAVGEAIAHPGKHPL